MMLQIVMVLGNSVSNSGQLNAISLITIFALDQLAVRLATCGIFWLACKVGRELALKG